MIGIHEWLVAFGWQSAQTGLRFRLQILHLGRDLRPLPRVCATSWLADLYLPSLWAISRPSSVRA